MNHQTRLLAHFAKGETITPTQAASELGNMRLASTVLDLREKGHSIVTELVQSTNRYGQPTSFARYRYGGGPG